MRLKIGVLGCANIAERSVIPAILSTKSFELKAVASRTKNKAETFASMFHCEAITGYQNLIDKSDIDAVYMPLPTGMHEEWVLKSLEAGKHVLVEKSSAIDYLSAQKMVKKATSNDLLIMENFMFLYHSQHQFVKKLLKDGEIGELRCFRSSFGFPPLDKSSYRYDKELGGGALLDAGTYTLRASQLFLGNDISVRASNLMYDDSGVDIYGGAYLANDSAFSEIAFGFDNFYQCRYELWGSTGKITAERAFTPGPHFKPKIIVERQDEKIVHEVDAENHFVNILKEFNRCIREKDFKAKYNAILNQSRLIQELRYLSNA